MKNTFTLFLFLIISTSWAQTVHETEFYKFILPIEYKASSSPTVREEFSNIDSFMLFKNESPRYLVFTTSNKLTSNFDGLTVTNYKDYLTDLGEITVITAERVDDFIKLTFFQDDADTKFIAYLTINNDILHRFIFFIPRKVGDIFDKEIAQIIKSTEYKKVHW